VQCEIARGKFNQRNFQKLLNSLNHESEDRIQFFNKNKRKRTGKNKRKISTWKKSVNPKLLVQIPEKILLKF
jgi:hypothetical protein